MKLCTGRSRPGRERSNVQAAKKKLTTEVRSQRSEVRDQKAEGRRQKAEVRSQKSEIRDQKSEEEGRVQSKSLLDYLDFLTSDLGSLCFL